MIWSHCGFQGVPPSSTFFTSIGVGGAGLVACACEAVAIPMKNTRLTMNDVFSAEILMFTGPPLPIDPVVATRLVTARLQVDRKDHAGIDAIFPGSTHPPAPEGRANRPAHGAHVLPAEHSLGSHATLRAFVAVFRAVRGFFRAAAAVFLALGAALTEDGNSSLGCFAVRWWPWFSFFPPPNPSYIQHGRRLK